MLLLPLLILLLFPSTALSRRQFDWNDCGLQACYVPVACWNTSSIPAGQKPSPNELVLVTPSMKIQTTECPFVMAIRPFSATVWVVQLRLLHRPRLTERRINITRDSNTVYQCDGHDNGSVTVTGGGEAIEVHPDSFRAHARMYCLFTVTSTSGILDTSGLHVTYDGQSTALVLDRMDKIMDYVSCDGTKITMSSLKPEDDNSIVAPVDVTRLAVACPPGKNWKLWIEDNGTLKNVSSIVCSPTLRSYYIEHKPGQLWLKDEFNAVCVTSLACSTCAPPLFSHCPLCALVKHWPGEEGHCSTLTCNNETSSGPSRFSIGGRQIVGEPVCGPREGGGGVGWSIKDARNRTVEFAAAACVKDVSCHSVSFLRLDCADPEQCAKPLAVEFEEGEGMMCPDRLRMRFRATDADAWTDAHDLLCDNQTGHWNALTNNDGKTALAHNSTVECVAPLDPGLFYGSIAVAVGILLFYATFLPHYLWTRKTDAEFDKRQAELSKAFAKIKEYPKSPEKSDKERSRQSEVKEEVKEEVGKPIVDTRIYPDELTLKRKKKKKKEDKKEEKKVVEDFLRPREIEDPVPVFCKSVKEGKEGWEQWIMKTGGIVQEKKPREEVLRIRAERKAAREKRIEEEKQRRAEEEKGSAKPDSPSSPAPKQSAVKSTGGGGGLATDQYLYKMGVTPPTTKKEQKEDRFVTIGALTPSRPAPKKYKKHSKGAAPGKEEEIRFDPPTISRDRASVLHLEPASKKRTEEFVTAEETSLHEETDAREKTPARTDDRAISASKIAPAKPSDLAPPRTDDRAFSASKMGPPAKPSDLAPPRTDDRAISGSKIGQAVHQSPKAEESGMADVAVEGTEDERRKRKKRKTKKTSKSGGSEDLPKTMTAVDYDQTVNVDRDSKKDKGVQSTPVMTSPSPLSPSNSTPTGETKHKRKKHRQALESKGIVKGLAKHLAKKGSGTRSPRNADKKE